MDTWPTNKTQGVEWLKTESPVLPQLTERLLLDLVNGLEVVDQYVFFRDDRSALRRLIDQVDGTAERRQHNIDRGQSAAIRALLAWAIGLTQANTDSNDLMTQMADTLSRTQEQVEFVLEHSIETRQQLEHLRLQVEHHLKLVDTKLHDIEVDNRSRSRIDEVIYAWRSGRYFVNYPPVIQAVFALQELARGDIGKLIYSKEAYREQVVDRVSSELLNTVGEIKLSFVLLDRWVSQYASTHSIEQKAVIMYLLPSRENMPYHNLITAYTSIGAIPEWLADRQREDLSVILGPSLLIRHFVSEIVEQETP